VSATTQRPIAIYYEHPDWFRPLFQELDRRGVPYVRVDAADHRFDAGDGRPPYSLVFNRMSPSAYLRGHGNAIFYTLHYLAYLKRHGVRVINGYDAYVTETSKALQLSQTQMGSASPQKRFFEIIQSPMLRSQSCSRDSPSGGIHLMVGTSRRMRSRQSMRMNHSSTGRKTSSSLQRQQCGYTCG